MGLMFFKKKPDAEYMLGHFLRGLDLLTKFTLEKEGKCNTTDIFHEYVFMLTYYTVAASNLTTMPQDEIEKFVGTATLEIQNRIKNFNLQSFEKNANDCADLLKKSDLYFDQAAREYYTKNIATDDAADISMENFTVIVNSASAGLLTLLTRDGYAKNQSGKLI